MTGNLLHRVSRLDLLFLGLTAIFIGYFMIWLPGPAAGLQLIGVELGEWIKFLGVDSRRTWFYFPPIVIGATLGFLAAMWPNDRRSVWLMRGLAIAVAMVAFPALAAIQLEPRSEWLARVLGIALVALVALAGALLSSRRPGVRWPWLAIGLVALAGAVLPTLQYFAIRPIVGAIMLRPVGIGPGVWLNAAGSLLVVAVALTEWRAARK
ncbi:MAG TPA: hypothetical protein PKE20_06560 [Promineifilum sp.]|nr:hypothetical protein [Promineifilum sp.]